APQWSSQDHGGVRLVAESAERGLGELDTPCVFWPSHGTWAGGGVSFQEGLARGHDRLRFVCLLWCGDRGVLRSYQPPLLFGRLLDCVCGGAAERLVFQRSERLSSPEIFAQQATEAEGYVQKEQRGGQPKGHPFGLRGNE